MQCQPRPEEGIRYPGTGVTDGCEQQYGVLRLESQSLIKQSVFLIKKPFLQLPWLIFNCQQGLLGFASLLYHYGWKENQTNLHLTDAFPTASAWQAECTTRFFISTFLLLSTGHAVTYQATTLYYQDLVVQCLCLLPAHYLKKIKTECATWSHTGSHGINPSSWDFPWSL